MEILCHVWPGSRLIFLAARDARFAPLPFFDEAVEHGY
jgi:hypothetical protein